ncbi:unnamed protein product, partial [Ectocarpus fasciculatus]
PPDVCSNGIPGIQSGVSCCLAECGECGGSGCAEYGGGLGADNCCESNIEEYGELCSTKLEAPCVVDASAPAPSPPTAPVAEPTAPVAEPTAPVAEPTAPVAEPTAPTGEISLFFTSVHVVYFNSQAVALLYDGAGLSTTHGIVSHCRSFHYVPLALCSCLPPDTCSNGIPGIQTGNACCVLECGQCGGTGCSLFGDGLGEDFCCQSDIEDFGELCSATKAAPCVVDDSAPAPSPVAMPTAPVAEPTAPVAEPTAPVAEPTAPVAEPTAP